MSRLSVYSSGLNITGDALAGHGVGEQRPSRGHRGLLDLSRALAVRKHASIERAHHVFGERAITLDGGAGAAVPACSVRRRSGPRLRAPRYRAARARRPAMVGSGARACARAGGAAQPDIGALPVRHHPGARCTARCHGGSLPFDAAGAASARAAVRRSRARGSRSRQRRRRVARHGCASVACRPGPRQCACHATLDRRQAHDVCCVRRVTNSAVDACQQQPGCRQARARHAACRATDRCAKAGHERAPHTGAITTGRRTARARQTSAASRSCLCVQRAG